MVIMLLSSLIPLRCHKQNKESRKFIWQMHGEISAYQMLFKSEVKVALGDKPTLFETAKQKLPE